MGGGKFRNEIFLHLQTNRQPAILSAQLFYVPAYASGIPYIPISAKDLCGAMIGNDLPEFMARIFVSFNEAMLQGYLDVM